MNDTLDSITSYVIAFWAALFANIDDIVSVGGFILLIIRLVADGPRAYKALRGENEKDSN